MVVKPEKNKVFVLEANLERGYAIKESLEDCFSIIPVEYEIQPVFIQNDLPVKATNNYVVVKEGRIVMYLLEYVEDHNVWVLFDTYGCAMFPVIIKTFKTKQDLFNSEEYRKIDPQYRAWFCCRRKLNLSIE